MRNSESYAAANFVGHRGSSDFVPMPLPLPDPMRVLEVAWKAVQSSRQAISVRDHTTLYRGRYSSNYSNMDSLYSVAACAPSWPFQRPHPVHPTNARAFLDDAFSGRFQLQPTESYGDVMVFESRRDSETWAPDNAARLYANGLVEFLIRVPSSTVEESGALTLQLLDCIEPWWRVAASVRTGSYRDLFGFRTNSRRIDWFFALGTTVAHRERGSLPWADLVFPGRQPSTRATRAFPAQTGLGFGYRDLRGRRQGADPVQILRPAIRELLVGSGWIDIEETVTDALAELQRNMSSSP